MSGAALDFLTEEEFIAFEMASSDRYEFIDGITRAMEGESIRHNEVSGNLAVALWAVAKSNGCKVNMIGVRLKINSRRHYYPDVMVTCEDPSDTHAHSAPCLIAEVLSPSTTLIDRGEKRIAYMAMPSLRHLLLIDLEANSIEHTWRHNVDDPWFFELGTADTELHITCPSVVTLGVNDIFA
jgi:Uma2 family endonuclease